MSDRLDLAEKHFREILDRYQNIKSVVGSDDWKSIQRVIAHAKETLEKIETERKEFS